MNYKIYKDNFKKCKSRGVYLIRNLDNGLLKIGKASNVSRRLNEIESSFKFCGVIPNLNIEAFIEYDDNGKLESYFHKVFDCKRVQNEWFDIQDSSIVLSYIENFKIEISKKKIIETNFENTEPKTIRLDKKDKHKIAIDYLNDKDFLYKIHLGIFLYGGYEDDRCYIIKNLARLSNMLKISINTIRKKISNYYNLSLLNPNINIEYIENICTQNYVEIDSSVLSKLISLDEMAIRLYVYIKNCKDECLYDNQLDILGKIGYSSKSNTNKTELTRNTNALKELKLINTRIVNNGFRTMEYVINTP